MLLLEAFGSELGRDWAGTSDLRDENGCGLGSTLTPGKFGGGPDGEAIEDPRFSCSDFVGGENRD